MKLIGLTGGIACGKSSVSRILRHEGLTVLDADDIAKQVVDKGRWGYRRVVRAFGNSVLLPDGQIDREALGEMVFANPTARRRLDAATHPAVGLALARALLLGWLLCRPAVVVDMPLLFESGFYLLCRPRVLVACTPATQLARLAARDGLSGEAAAARVAAQMPLERKRQLADIVVENDGSLAELEAAARGLAARLCRGGWAHTLLSPPGLATLAAAVLAAARCWVLGA
eukprot:scaffold1.g5667.t1